MTISDRLAQAISGALVAGGVTTTVQGGIELTENAAYTSRVICTVESCTQRSAALRGIYNAQGQVHVLQSIDETDADTNFRALCTAVECVLGHETDSPTNIMAQDGSLHIYNRSWHLDQQSDDAGERGFKGTFSWRAVVRHNISD